MSEEEYEEEDPPTLLLSCNPNLKKANTKNKRIGVFRFEEERTWGASLKDSELTELKAGAGWSNHVSQCKFSQSWYIQTQKSGEKLSTTTRAGVPALTADRSFYGTNSLPWETLSHFPDWLRAICQLQKSSTADRMCWKQHLPNLTPPKSSDFKLITGFRDPWLTVKFAQKDEKKLEVTKVSCKDLPDQAEARDSQRRRDTWASHRPLPSKTSSRPGSQKHRQDPGNHREPLCRKQCCRTSWKSSLREKGKTWWRRCDLWRVLGGVPRPRRSWKHRRYFNKMTEEFKQLKTVQE